MVDIHSTISKRTVFPFAWLVFCTIAIVGMVCGNTAAQAQGGLTLTSGATFTLTNGAVFTIDGSIAIGTGATLRQDGAGTLSLSGNWINDGLFLPGTGLVIFQTTATQTIQGIQPTTFFDLQMLKFAVSNILQMDQSITVNGNFALAQGTFRLLNTASRTLALSGNLTIPAQAALDVAAGGSASHTVTIAGGIANDNILNLNPGGSAADVVFTSSGSVTVAGNGATTSFRSIALTKPSKTDIVQVLAPSFAVPPSGFLTLVGGTLRLSGTYALANPVFTTATYSIPSSAGLWVDNGAVDVTGQNGTATLGGLLRVSAGAMRVGTGANQNHLLYSSGAELTMDGGSLTVTGRLSRDGNSAASLTYVQSTGAVVVGAGVNSSATDRGMFDIGAAASSFTWSGGSIELRSHSLNTDGNGGDFFINTVTGSVTTGTLLRVAAGNGGQNIRISSKLPIGELLMTGANDPVVKLVGNPLRVLGNITLAGSGVGRFDANGQNITLAGNWINNGTSNQAFTPSTALVTMNGNGLQFIRGTVGTTFYHFNLDKQGNDTLRLEQPTRINGNLRLLTNTVLDIDLYNLTIGPAGSIYTDNASATAFSASRSIRSLGNTVGGRLYREIPAGTTTLHEIYFPMSAAGAYTPAQITFHANKATFNTGATVGMGIVAQEHPAVERNNISMQRYWVITSANITLQDESVNLLVSYNVAEVQGNEGQYEVLCFSPSYPHSAGFWHINPGQSFDVVDFNLKQFYSEGSSFIDGDWTAGERDAGAAIYYSRTNGDFNTPSTWSKVNFNGPASTTIPNKRSDKVRIQGHTVTVSSTTASVNLLSVEQNATLRLQGNQVMTGDTVRIMSQSRIEIGHKDGLYAVGSTGAIQTAIRSFSPTALYVYNGIGSQFTGTGLPSPVSSIVIEKAPTDTLKLNSFIAIGDSLVLNNGIVDIAEYSINGNTASRRLTMRGGELLIRSAFPTNYMTPTFTTGTITFNGSGNTTIPSSLSSPAVAQYHNLKLGGQRNGVFTFSAAGQIRIANQFDMSTLVFTGSVSSRFSVDGSTVIFNGTGIQSIPCRPLAPADTVFTLKYYNLIAGGSGIKQLLATTATTFVVVNDITIQTGATLSANGFNIDVQRNWVNTGGIFNPGTASVLCRSTVPLNTTFITSRSTTDNPFYHLVITGQGNVRPVDNLLVQGNLTITTSATLSMSSTGTVTTLLGNWINQGNFVAGISTVVFNGFVQQTMTRTTGSESFYNLTVQNTAGVNATGVGTTSNDGVVIANVLHLLSGNIITRGRYATALGSVVRTGSATPGHVDGPLRKSIASGANSTVYEVGLGATYTPATLDVQGTGGTAGLVAVVSDTVTAASTPIATGLTPTNSGINDARHVRRQWGVAIPSGSAFVLGTNRSYDATFTFKTGASPVGDIRGGSDPLFFEVRMWNGSSWIAPNRLAFPRTGLRTATTAQMRTNKVFGTFTLGEPTQYSFYSIANGNWSTPSSWSTQDYGGVATTIQPTATALVYVGDGKTIALDANQTCTNPGVMTIDSSGRFLTETSNLSGTGTFQHLAHGTLGIGDVAGIVLSGSTGSIRTSTRLYNPSSHNKGHYIYTNAAAQASGDGLPGTMLTLTVQKNAGTALTLGSNITIVDSLHVQDGTMNGSSRTVTLQGHMRVSSTATFTPATSTVVFSGTTTQTVTALGGTLQLYRLTISKTANTGNVLLSSNTNITINNTLLFAGSNAGTIDARTSTNAYVTALGSVTRTGLGHIDGELRKNIPTGSNTTLFEVGESVNYTPFIFTMTNAGGTAGIIGMNAIPGKHPNLDNAYVPPIEPNRYIPRYWRLTRPASSTFDRGTRSMTVTLQFLDPNDLGLVDAAGCLDMAYWKGNTDWWQSLRPNSTGSNFSSGYSCGDSRFNLGGIDYDGSANSVIVNSVPADTTLGSNEFLADGSLLLGDFITGNQNSVAITTYYSRQSGNWSDPNTWSIVSHTGPAATTYPATQYHIVFIGDNDRVFLDENIGTGRLYGDFARNQYYGPMVTVNATGTFALGSHILRGQILVAKKGATLEIGAAAGLIAQGNGFRGNVYCDSRAIEDSVNIVYTADGYTPAMSTGIQAYCRPSMNAGSYYIEEVEIRDASNTTLMNNTTGSALKNNPATFYFPYKSATLVAGQQYTVRMNPRSNGGTNRWTVWIDYDLDGVFEDTYEQVISQTFSGSSVQSATFTVPSSTTQVLPGVTHMRVMYKSGTGSASSCTSNSGEVEDYTIRLVQDSRQVDQSTGTGLPTTVGMFEVRSTRAVTGTIELETNINVVDSLKMSSGHFDITSRTIRLAGDVINNSNDNFLVTGSTIEYIDSKEQRIRGSVPTTFNNIRLNKTPATGKVTLLATSATVLGAMTFDADNLFALSTNTTLTFGANATVTSGSMPYSSTRMLQVTGTTGTGLVQKQFSTAVGAKSFLFPIGVDTVYNSAYISATGSYTGTPTLGVSLYASKHPQRLSENTLKKYWRVTTSNISAITANSLQFVYATPDISGEQTQYIPAQYASSQWEINVGTTPIANPSPIVVSNTSNLGGDWTAGEADGFFTGRIFYSINTGNWNTPANWSNIGHSGTPASYYPGQLYTQDTVLLDGHTMTFNVDSVTVDSLQVGGVFNGTGAGGRGILVFGSTPLAKKFAISRNIGVLTDGRIEGTTPGSRRDTLHVLGAFSNASLSASSAGIFLWGDASNYTVLDLEGSGTSHLTGEGVWGALAPIIINKTGGMADTLVNMSGSFANATGMVPQYTMQLHKGIVRQAVTGATLSLSYGAATVQMESFTGFDVWAGSILASSSLLSNVNTSLRVNGGMLRVGDSVNEHFFYKTGTRVDIINGEMQVAGCFTRDAAPSTVEFAMSTAGTVRVLAVGNTDPVKIGFDISNAASSFSMTGGRIIVASGTVGANADYNVSATDGTGMVGGTLQTGDSSITAPGAVIRVVGSMPVRSWHSVGNGAISQVAGEVFTVVDSLKIDNNHSFYLYGNTLLLGGNLSNYGVFDATTGSTPVEERLLVANGAGNDQLFYNDDPGGLVLYNFRVDKAGGTVTLGNGSNSNLIVRNALEFALDNTGIINARTYNRFVEVSTDGTTTPQVLRNGLGHVDGRLYRTVGTGAQFVPFAIGTSATISGYTPAVFETVGSGGTAGLVGMITYGNDHPNVTSALVRTENNIQRYWNVTTANGFALGAGRTYSLTTQFLNPEDLRNSPNILFLEHHRYTAACPDPPAACPPGTGSWYSAVTPSRTDTTVTSEENTEYGDFIIAEPSGFTFYSIANGAWDNPATWSMESYLGAPAPRAPSLDVDVVHIGNGRRVTVPEIITPKVRAVYVEKFNNLPGELYINGNLGYVRGLSFVLEDDCTLGVQHLNGIAPDGTAGAVQTGSRNFGVGRFVYNSIYGGQNSGQGLPDSVASLIVDNPSPNVNTLYIANYSGASSIKVRDTVAIERGTMNAGGRDMVLYRDMVLRNNGVYVPLLTNFTIAGTTNHTITLDNTSGVRFNNLLLSGGNVLAQTTVSSATAHIYVASQLQFVTSAIVNVRDYNRRVVMATGATVLRPVNGGHVDGTLRKPFTAGAGSVQFEIGNGSDYTPATLTFTNVGGNGTAGSIDAINLTPVPPEPFVGNRMDPNVFVPRYWSISPADGFTMGARRLNTLFGFPASEATPLDLARAVIRSRKIPAALPLWRDRRDLLWNASTATVELAPVALEWEGLGDFFIGQKAQRIFYSRQNGPWDDNNSWSFFGHTGPPVPAGEYPNPDWMMPTQYEFETRDSAIIGGSDTIRLNTLPEVAYIEIASTGTLLVENTRYLSATSLGGSAFIMRNDGNLHIQTAEGIEPGLSGILRFPDVERVFEPAANYEFSGALTQHFGGAFPTMVNNITVNTDNNTRAVLLNRSGISVNGLLDIRRGMLEFDNSNALGAPANQAITLNGDMRIATGATLTIEPTGTGPRTHTLTLNGNVLNNGSWIMCLTPNPSNLKGETIFSSTASQTITGTGSINRLYGATLDKGSPLATVTCSVDIDISRDGAPAFTFTNGTWEQTAGTLSLKGCAPATTQSITANGALHLTGSSNLLQDESLVLSGGELVVNTTGAAIVGTGIGDNLVFENSPNNRLTVINGNLTVAGRVSEGDSPGNLIYNQSGGAVTVGAVGDNSDTHGMFDLGSGSSFTMTDGNLVIRNANSSSAPTRPADLTLDGTVATSGGTIQFGDDQTTGSPVFNYDVVPTAALWNVAVSNANATLHPFEATSVLRLQGNLANEGTIDATQTRTGVPATSATVVFQGSGADNQAVTGSGSTTLQNLTMNRGAGTGVVEVQQNLTVAGTLDLQEGGNPNSQIIELPVSTANLSVTNCDPAAIADAGTTASPYRYIRTSSTGGQLIRNICPSGVYVYPIGSFDGGQDYYTPSTFTAGPTGTEGTVGVRVSRGSGAQGGHAHILPTASDYLERYWAVDNVTTTIAGQWRFEYPDDPANITGSEANFTRVGRWTPPFETAGGSWTAWTSTVNTTSNFFESPAGLPASDFRGDWTVGGDDVFRRIFYSLMAGKWSNANSWTFSPTHVGPIAGVGIYPNDIQDSVVIGGGNNGVNNHVISLDANIAVSGVSLGTSTTNTGTLLADNFVLSGNTFTMRDNSTLGIGSANGITQAPATSGSIQTVVRSYAPTGNYIYNGTANQVLGNGLPPVIRSITVDNSGGIGNNTVLLGNDVNVTNDMSVLQGILDMQSFALNNVSSTGNFVLATNATLQIAGSNTLATAAANYSAYSIDAQSIVEFYGNNQIIPDAPNGGIGYGHVVISQSGQKFVASPVLVRGDLSVRTSAYLENQAGVNALQVLGTVRNDGTLVNSGTIRIGN